MFPIGTISIQKPKKDIAALNFKQKLTFAVFVLAAALWVSGSLQKSVANIIGWVGMGHLLAFWLGSSPSSFF
jgi:hypothetical protein